jgi:hypothetical protein
VVARFVSPGCAHPQTADEPLINTEEVAAARRRKCRRACAQIVPGEVDVVSAIDVLEAVTDAGQL